MELNKKLQEELEKVLKTLDLKSIDWDTFKVIATNASVDRDGEIITLDGWDIENYLKNPVIIANHSYKIENLIGKATKIYSDWQNVIVEWVFSKTNPLGILARDLYNEGILKAVSVWFISKQRDEENRDIITIKELLELSFVAVPCNPNAISLDWKWLELYKKWVEAGLIQEEKKTMEQRLAKKVVKFECIRWEWNMDWACYCEDLYRDFSVFDNYNISEQWDKVPKSYLRKFLVLDDFAFDHYRE